MRQPLHTSHRHTPEAATQQTGKETANPGGKTKSPSSLVSS